ncbi:hypothetical protein QBC38DRAFT_548154 [Podospora fimiseda]|uniref:Nephrocystin 3-like N-terminal domain-containing protein n=1 Tax=Podospora fimiseda TaxID=252190 RepID=A0AAN7BHW7_9PEZI|nr:hypothetical protein QBC38DRAFT_548154 [Podospora fimiseda]
MAATRPLGTTERLQGRGSKDNIGKVLQSIFELDTPFIQDQGFEIHSFCRNATEGAEYYVATLSFKTQHRLLLNGKNQWYCSFEAGMYYTLDSHFHGLSTLFVPESTKHKADIIAIPGIGGHALGSFKERSGSYMWLRDILPLYCSTARIMTFGYDSKIPDSTSFQWIESIAARLRITVDEILSDQNRKPLVFIAHSFGGIVWKEAIIQSKEDEESLMSECTHGAMLFGVPNKGMENASLIAMAKGQPNEGLIKDGKWRMIGDKTCLVSPESANHCRPSEDILKYQLGLDRTHSELVKFAPDEADLKLIRPLLQRLVMGAEAHRLPGMDENLLREISTWLSPCDPNENHEIARSKLKYGGTTAGSWLTGGEAFKNWKSSSRSFMCIYGIPGSGKTVLSSIIIENIKTYLENLEVKKGHAAYSYFDFNTKKASSLSNLLKSLILQLSHTRLSNKLKESYRNLYGSNEGLAIPELTKILLEVLRQLGPTYIVVDALDECDSSEQEDQLKNRREFRYLTVPWRDKIRRDLTTRAGGMFLYVDCQLNTLAKCRSAKEMIEAIDEFKLPRSIEDTYTQVLECLPQNNQSTIVRILHWLTFAKAPLVLDEARDIEMTRPQEEDVVDINERPFSGDNIVQLCGPLVAIGRRELKHGESEGRRSIKLAHSTVKTYLLQRPTHNPATASRHLMFCFDETTALFSILGTCLNYLLYAGPELAKQNISAGRKQTEYPLYNHTARFWFEYNADIETSSGGTVHLEQLNEQMQGLERRILRLIEDDETYSSWISEFNPDEKYPTGESEPKPSKLYISALLGLSECANAIASKWSFSFANDEGGYHGTALHAAVMKQNTGLVHMLAEPETVNTMRGLYRTALQAACASGTQDLSIIRQLLDKGAKCDLPGGAYGSALHAAAARGNLEMLELLINFDDNTNLNLISGYYGTPLDAALTNQNHDVALYLQCVPARTVRYTSLYDTGLTTKKILVNFWNGIQLTGYQPRRVTDVAALTRQLLGNILSHLPCPHSSASFIPSPFVPKVRTSLFASEQRLSRAQLENIKTRLQESYKVLTNIMSDLITCIPSIPGHVTVLSEGGINVDDKNTRSLESPTDFFSLTYRQLLENQWTTYIELLAPAARAGYPGVSYRFLGILVHDLETSILTILKKLGFSTHGILSSHYAVLPFPLPALRPFCEKNQRLNTNLSLTTNQDHPEEIRVLLMKSMKENLKLIAPADTVGLQEIIKAVERSTAELNKFRPTLIQNGEETMRLWLVEEEPGS